MLNSAASVPLSDHVVEAPTGYFEAIVATAVTFSMIVNGEVVVVIAKSPRTSVIVVVSVSPDSKLAVTTRVKVPSGPPVV